MLMSIFNQGRLNDFEKLLNKIGVKCKLESRYVDEPISKFCSYERI